MRWKRSKDVAASVRQRLLHKSRVQGEDFQLVLIKYVAERLLYRLSQSAYSEKFILKGAMLFSVWGGTPHRATRDLDLLGTGNNRIPALEEIFREICRIPVEDAGLEFLHETVRGEEIQEEQEYEGVRLSFRARLAEARIPLQVDIGFGDAVTPSAEIEKYPTLLDFPAPHLLVYPREAVVAEKFQAMVIFGIANSRMRDFFDIWFLSRHFEFFGTRLCSAIQATFDQRKTPLRAQTPLALTAAFYEDPDKQRQWQGLLHRLREVRQGLPFPAPGGPARHRKIGRVYRVPGVRRGLPGRAAPDREAIAPGILPPER
ncbi:MAG: nucleotidyl transferase AbiEii/AbiGii toxin family protein [Acidobacteria bacterium]|nr:nucleotidyl transferase AbiEii/AbiGii toxin family protein [Acidobacteriota bacterium]